MELHTNRFVLVSTFGRLCLAEADTTVLVSAYTVTLIQKKQILYSLIRDLKIVYVMIKVKGDVDDL